MSHHFHNHELCTVGSRNPPAPRYSLSPFLPGTQGGRNHRTNPRVTLQCPQPSGSSWTHRWIVSSQSECNYFIFLPIPNCWCLEINCSRCFWFTRTKMRMQKTGSVEWFEFPLQLQFISTIWFCAFLIYISPVLAEIGGWGSHCHRPLGSPVSHSAPTVAGHTVDQDSATKSATHETGVPIRACFEGLAGRRVWLSLPGKGWSWRASDTDQQILPANYSHAIRTIHIKYFCEPDIVLRTWHVLYSQQLCEVRLLLVDFMDEKLSLK